MDLDVYVARHGPTWDRLEVLLRKPGRLRGAELDELVDVYQRTATHLSVVRTSLPDPLLVARLSQLVGRARGAIGSRREVGWRAVAVYLVRTFPAAAYRARWWWLGAAVVCLSISVVEASWIITHPAVQARLLPRAEVRQLVDHDFAGYYHAAPHSSFAAQVWTNNAFTAAECLVGGVLLGIVPAYLLFVTAVAQLGPSAGYLIAAHHGGQFFALILPHGLLELTAVFLAAGAGLRLGWVVVAPGARSRGRALAEEGRTTIALVPGLALALLVSGLIEGFVTPSSIPPVPRVAIGVLAWQAFLSSVLLLGRRAVSGGVTGDLTGGLAGSGELEV